MLGKPTLSLYYFKKSRDLLQKISASPEDRELLLVTSNYSNQLEKITENMALNFVVAGNNPP